MEASGQETFHSELAQKSVLGSVLLANGMLRGPLADLAISDFVGSDYQQIFSTIVTLDSEGLPFDAILLADRLPDKAALIGDLIDHATNVARIAAQHAATIRTFSKLRRLMTFAHALQRKVQTGANPDVLLEQAEEMLARLRNGFDLTGEMLPYAPANGHRRPEILQLSAVESRAVDWLWRPYLAFGMLAMLSGDPGAGKSFCAMAIAAALTTGGTPRSYDPVPPLDVLYLTIENSPEHVLRPRFDRLGGDPKRFHVLCGSLVGDGKNAVRGSVTLSDISLIDKALVKTGARLIVIDPIQSYIGAQTDMHRANETRPVLDGLSKLATQHNAAVLLIRHLSKAGTGRAIHRGLGSIDLTGAVRTELLAGTTPDGTRVFCQIKNNVGEFGKSLGYEITGDGDFRWTGETALKASDLFAPEHSADEDSPRADAIQFLRDKLKDGARPSKEMEELAEREGIASRTLKRAMKQIGVVSRKEGFQGPWFMHPSKDVHKE